MLTRERIVEIIYQREYPLGSPWRHHPEVKESVEQLAGAILAEMEEPLAVLADRKNYWIDTYQNRNLSFRIRATEYRQIVAHQVTEPKEFRGDTYTAAELKAREFLSTLPDKEGKK